MQYGSIRVVKLAALVAALLSLQGCWFVFIPSSLLAGEPFYCVGPDAKVGEQIKLTDGRQATIKATFGRYDKCREKYAERFPVKADLQF